MLAGLLSAKKQLNKADLGKWGESKAAKYLRRAGYDLLTRNYRCFRGEIDIVAVDPDENLVFVEVKTRISEEFTEAETAVDTEKRRRLIRAAKHFISSYDLRHRPSRFDVLIVIPGNWRPQIRHHKHAFVG